VEFAKMSSQIPLAIGQRRYCLVPTLETFTDANSYARYLFCPSPLSFTVYFTSGHQYPSQNLTFNSESCRLRCIAGPWRYDFTFSSDFSFIQSGFVVEIQSDDFWIYGLNSQDIIVASAEERYVVPSGEFIGQLEYREQTDNSPSPAISGGDVPSVSG
jgi:hypothetical protein